MSGYWMKPKVQGKCFMFGPIQFNWYDGFRIHFTWPVLKTFNIH